VRSRQAINQGDFTMKGLQGRIHRGGVARRAWTLVACTLWLCLPLAASAASPTLERIVDRGEIRLGFVPDAPPMSFTDEDGNANGYTIALCRNVVSFLQRRLGLDELSIRFVPLTALEERLAAVEGGDVDIECGASTVTLARRERVDFSLMTFITGGAVLSLAKTPIAMTTDMHTRRIAVLRGSTTEQALGRYREVNQLEMDLVVLDSNAQGLAMLNAGDVDGLASDRAMLVGQALQTGRPADYLLTQDVFSFEPYALMVARGDTEFRLLVDSGLAELYRSARIRRLYQDWFGRYGLPLPAIVEAMYEFQAIAD
jgi:ABC-type amino acid transport substrate-binding protein